MTYITPGNSLVTGATVIADLIYSNFVDFTDGLSDGTKNLYVNKLTVAATLTVGSNITSTGEFRVDGTDKGAKYWIPLTMFASGTFYASGTGYVGDDSGGKIITANCQPVYMPNTGSVRCFMVQYSSEDSTDQEFTVQCLVNGSSVGSITVVRSQTTTWYQTLAIARGVASFASGGKICAYIVSNVSAITTTQEGIRICTEVQFDV